MATQDEKFRHAAWAYFIYGVVYWAGGLYLYVRGVAPGRGGGWFILGAFFVIVFPFLVARGCRGSGYLWFSRILTLFVAFRAFGVGRVMLRPSMPTVPLPGGGEIPMGLGAGIFFGITLITMTMLARAAWSRRE